MIPLFYDLWWWEGEWKVLIRFALPSDENTTGIHPLTLFKEKRHWHEQRHFNNYLPQPTLQMRPKKKEVRKRKFSFIPWKWRGKESFCSKFSTRKRNKKNRIIINIKTFWSWYGITIVILKKVSKAAFHYGLILCRKEGGWPWVSGHYCSPASFSATSWGSQHGLAGVRAPGPNGQPDFLRKHGSCKHTSFLHLVLMVQNACGAPVVFSFSWMALLPPKHS